MQLRILRGQCRLFISDPQLAAQKFRNQNDLDGCEPGAAKGAAAGMERAFGWIHASDRLVLGDGHVMSVPCRAARTTRRAPLFAPACIWNSGRRAFSFSEAATQACCRV